MLREYFLFAQKKQFTQPFFSPELRRLPFWRVPKNVFDVISIVYVRGESARMNVICVLSVVYAWVKACVCIVIVYGCDTL